jgi:RHS repeat-associated protein
MRVVGGDTAANWRLVKGGATLGRSKTATSTGDRTIYYLYGPGGIPFEQVTTAGTVTYLHADQLGSIRMLTDSTGKSVGTATYAAYGTRTATGTTSAFGYAGQYTDTESGLQWLRARYYDPTTGQFLTVDPLAAATGARYAYAGGNPITGADPSGLDWYNPLTWTGDTYDVIAGVASATALVLQLPSLVVAATGLGLSAAGVLEEVATGAGLVAGLASIGGVAQHLREGDSGRAALSAVGAIPLLGLGAKGIYSLVRFSAAADAGGSIARGVGSGWRWAATRASAVGALAEGARAWWEVGQNLYCNRDLLW